MMEPVEVRTFPIEVRSAEGRTIEGKACPYGGRWDVGGFDEQLAPGVFSKSIREAAIDLPLLRFHDHQSVPVGKAVAWREADDGLYGTWELDTREEAAEAARLAREGYLTGLSVGFAPIRSDWDESGERAYVVRREARLLETSLVPVPAFPDARVIVVRSLGVPERPETAVVPRKPTPRMDALRAYLGRFGA
jgi:HK97 family phage prohead protease